MEKQRKVGRLATMAAALSAALAVATNGTQGTVGKYNVASAQETAQNERTIVAEAAEASVAASGADERFEPRGKAFLVAGDDYAKKLPELPGARKDVESLAARLVELGFDKSDITVLKTGGLYENFPVKKHIEERFGRFAESLKPGDFAFVFLSGHGVQASDTKESFFVPIDFEPSDPLETSVSINAMTTALEKSDAKFRWVVVDACRNDSGNPERSPFPWRAAGAKALTDPISAPDSTSVMQSCQPGKSSFEIKDGNGLLTTSLLEALDLKNAVADANGDGALGFNELVKYVTKRTDALAGEHFNETQKPTLSGKTEDFTLMVYGDLSTEDWRRANALYLEGSALRKEKRWTEAAAKIGEALEIAELEACRWEAGTIAEVLALQEAAKEAEAAFKAAETAFRTAEEAASKAKWKRGDVPPPPTGGWSNAPAGTLKTLKGNDIEYRFHYCPAGEFTMGSPASESDRDSDEGPQRKVTLDGFWMQETEVTQAMWKAVMGSNPSKFTSSERNPVETVSWNDCQEFVKKLNSLGVAPRGFQFRLPSEAEWEYACRAGAAGPYAGASLDALGWYDDNSGDRTHEVGTKGANAWGLYDMHGNVWEWCEDWYDSKYYEKSNNVQNPINVTQGSFRVLRGGSWVSSARHCRSAYRSFSDPSYRNSSYGFRLALVRSSSSSK